MFNVQKNVTFLRYRTLKVSIIIYCETYMLYCIVQFCLTYIPTQTFACSLVIPRMLTKLEAQDGS
jgi:hypothetical protein